MIRRYGPGKFNTIIDKYVYELTLDGGGDDELGDVQGFGFLCRLTLGKEGLEAIARAAKEDPTHAGGKRHGDLTLEEARLIRRSYGAIMEKTDSGFVGVDYYRTKREYDKAWEKIEKQYEKYEENMDNDS